MTKYFAGLIDALLVLCSLAEEKVVLGCLLKVGLTRAESVSWESVAWNVAVSDSSSVIDRVGYRDLVMSFAEDQRENNNHFDDII